MNVQFVRAEESGKWCEGEGKVAYKEGSCLIGLYGTDGREATSLETWKHHTRGKGLSFSTS